MSTENLYLTQLKQHALSIGVSLRQTEAEIDHLQKMLCYANEQKAHLSEALVNAHKQIAIEEEDIAKQNTDQPDIENVISQFLKDIVAALCPSEEQEPKKSKWQQRLEEIQKQLHK